MAGEARVESTPCSTPNSHCWREKKREGGQDDQDVPQSLFDDTLQIWKLLQREQVDVGRIWKCVAKLLVESFVHLGRAQHLKDPPPSRGASRLGTGSRDVDGVGKD